MKQTFIAVTVGLTLVLFVNAKPYAHSSDSTLQEEGYEYKKASSRANSNSYSQVNQENVEINGVRQGQIYTGQQSSAYSVSAASHGQSNSFASNTVKGHLPGLRPTQKHGDSETLQRASQIGHDALLNSKTDFVKINGGAGNAIEINRLQVPTLSSAGVDAAVYVDNHSDNIRSTKNKYWWNGDESPFKAHPQNGCDSPSCISSISFGSRGNGNSNQANTNVKVQITKKENPFIHQTLPESVSRNSFGFANSKASAEAMAGESTETLTSVTAKNAHGFQKNPFFSNVLQNNAQLSSHSSSQNNIKTHVNANVGLAARPIVSENVYNNPGKTVISQSSSYDVNVKRGNPFLKPGTGSAVLTPIITEPKPESSAYSESDLHQQRDRASSFEKQFESNAESSGFLSSEQVSQVRLTEVESDLTANCDGEGKLCVPINQCINGFVNIEERNQIRKKSQRCNIQTERCCNVKTIVNQGFTSFHHNNNAATKSEHRVTINANSNAAAASSGLFTSSGNSDIELNAGEYEYKHPAKNFPLPREDVGYLPPLGSEPSSNVPAFSKPPAKDKEGESKDAAPTANKPTISFPTPQEPTNLQIGCAAALVCVEEKFCTMTGEISPTPVALTSEQLIRRVPLSNCRNPDNGVIGKCCRDPNYVDPWPTGNLPANYTGGFDEQGFPTFLNIAKTRPQKKPSKVVQPVKTTRPKEIRPVENESKSPSFLIPQRVAKPNVSIVSTTTKAPSLIVDSKNYDYESTNQSPVYIPPHTPGVKCGLRNKVKRPIGLSDVDVAFGEIPWQAMVLSEKDKKILCSGVIVAPNAVLTSAKCVEKLQPSEVSIKAGEWKLGYELKFEEPYPFEIVKVISIVPHPGYSSHSLSYDMAILYLEHPVKFDQHVDTICIPDLPTSVPQTKCIATGWGKTVLQVNVAGALMHSIDVDVLTAQECKQRVANAESPIALDESMICVKSHKQKNNLCQVDVGGPLACERGDGFYELIGVYSQDTGCLPTNQVATFTLIDTDWVKKMIHTPPTLELKAPSTDIIYPSQSQKVHTHVEEKPCDCQQSTLESKTNQYLPPLQKN